MKFEVSYLAIDKSDNATHRNEVIEADDKKAVHSKIRKANKGCLLRDIRIKAVEDEDDAPVEVKRCPTCNKQLTDGGQCPVCDLGDEDAREGHTIYSMDEHMEGKEFRELLAIAKEIGIRDAKDLLKFYQEHPAEDKDKLAVIKDYRAELGDDFKLKESCNKVLREAKEDAIKARAKKDKESGVALDPLNPDDMEAVADEYGYDEEETATYRKHYFGESVDNDAFLDKCVEVIKGLFKPGVECNLSAYSNKGRFHYAKYTIEGDILQGNLGVNPDTIAKALEDAGACDVHCDIYTGGFVTWFNKSNIKDTISASIKEVSVEEFWGLVCSGKDDEIFKICSGDRDPKKNYNRFGSDHSYIMGALRNGNYSTAKILLTFGHKILEHESYEVVAELLKAKGIK